MIDGGMQNVGCKSFALSSYRANRLRPDFHIRYLSIGHCLALWLDLGTRTLALSDDDRQYLRDAGCVFAYRIAKSRRAQKRNLVHGLVERGARRGHGRSVLQRWGGTRSFSGRCARSLPDSYHTWRFDAADRESLSMAGAMAAIGT